jgi:glutathione S-transferase
MGEALTVLDIAWLIYAHRLSLAGYPFERLHPHVFAWNERLSSRSEFAKEIELLRHSKEELERVRRAQEKTGNTLEAVAGF